MGGEGEGAEGEARGVGRGSVVVGIDAEVADSRKVGLRRKKGEKGEGKGKEIVHCPIKVRPHCT